MSYHVYDENGYVGDFATTKGLRDFMEWCKSLDDIEIQGFTEDAMYIFPLALKESLDEFDPPLGDIKKTYDNFMDLLPKCKGIVMISDGANDDLDQIEEVV
jgi:hypothetical protein